MFSAFLFCCVYFFYKTSGTPGVGDGTVRGFGGRGGMHTWNGVDW